MNKKYISFKVLIVLGVVFFFICLFLVVDNIIGSACGILSFVFFVAGIIQGLSNKNRQNFKNWLIPFKKGLEKKWWHRLAQVIIFFTTILIFLMLLSIMTALQIGILGVFIFTFCSFVFMEAILYRALLYIIYGNFNNSEK